MGLQRAHAERLGQGQSLLVVGFGLRDIGGSAGRGRRRAGTAPRASLPVPCAAGPGRAPARACCQASSHASRQETDLTELATSGLIVHRAVRRSVPSPPPGARAPRRGARRAHTHSPGPPVMAAQPGPVAGGATEGQALLHTRMAAPGPLGRGTEGRGAAGHTIGAGPRPSIVGEAERLLPVASALGELPRARSRPAPAAPETGCSTACTGRASAPCPAPPRSAGAARPPGRSRRWHHRFAPGDRRLALAGRGSPSLAASVEGLLACRDGALDGPPSI